MPTERTGHPGEESGAARTLQQRHRERSGHDLHDADIESGRVD